MRKGLREGRKEDRGGGWEGPGVGGSALAPSFQMCPRTAMVRRKQEGYLSRKDAPSLTLTVRAGGIQLPLVQECEKEGVVKTEHCCGGFPPVSSALFSFSDVWFSEVVFCGRGL